MRRPRCHHNHHGHHQHPCTVTCPMPGPLPNLHQPTAHHRTPSLPELLHLASVKAQASGPSQTTQQDKLQASKPLPCATAEAPKPRTDSRPQHRKPLCDQHLHLTDSRPHSRRHSQSLAQLTTQQRQRHAPKALHKNEASCPCVSHITRRHKRSLTFIDATLHSQHKPHNQPANQPKAR